MLVQQLSFEKLNNMLRIQQSPISKEAVRNAAILQKEVYDRDWRNESFIIKSCFNQFKDLGKCYIDFTGVEHFEPLPLLSLNHLIINLLIEDCQVNLILPPINNHTSFNTKSFLNFIIYEGFLDLIIRTSEEMGKDYLTLFEGKVETSLVEYSSKLGKPLYTTSYQFKPYSIIFSPLDFAELGSVEHEQQLLKADDIINDYIANVISRAIQSKVPESFQPMVIYKLRTALRECVHNSIEHGYTYSEKQLNEIDFVKPKKGIVSFYVRFREGFIGASSENKSRLIKQTQKESFTDDSVEIPKVCSKTLLQTAGAFELFVLDNGQGITSSLFNESGNKNLNSVMFSTFHDGQSRKILRKNKNGGLNLIAQLSLNNRDFVRVLDSGQWWGAYLPLTSQSQEGVSIERNHTVGTTIDENAIGCALHFRYTWPNTFDSLKELSAKWQSDLGKSKSREIYSLSFGSSKPSFIDCRTQQKNEFFGNTENLYLLLRPNLDRADILKKVNDFLSSIEGIVKTLILADVAVHEHVIYKEALDHSEVGRVDKIIVVTTSLHYKVFTSYKGKLFEKNEFFHIANYLYDMKIIDSDYIWKQVNTNNKYLFINERIRWNKSLVIEGYLNFQDLFSDLGCCIVSAFSLLRYAASLNQQIFYHPVDSLVESLKTILVDTNRLLNTSNKKECNKLNLGSVLVTGKTAKSIIGILEEELTYFFIHPSTTESFPCLFFWLSEHLLPSKAVTYQRIGNTPHIAKGGWKSFTIPRYLSNGERAYVSNSAQIYKNLQDYARPIAKLGHWKYGKNHDFLGLNMIKSFDFANDHIGFNHDSELATYFCYFLFRLFKITSKKELTQQGWAIFAKAKKQAENYKSHIVTLSSSEIPLVVYPQHTSTRHFVNFFLSLLSDTESSVKIQESIIPIVSTKQRVNKFAYQLSGLSRIKLQDFVSSVNPKDVVTIFFDDAIITSQTFNNIKYNLKGLGLERIEPLWLLNRSRITQSENLKPMKTFTRLDIPALGDSDACTICKALKVAESMKQETIIPDMLDRIDEWLKEWSAKDIYSDWGNSVISPIFVSLSESKRKFSIHPLTGEQLGTINDECGINIQNSLGLIAWLTELQTITGRENFALNLVDEELLTNEVSLQVLCSQLFIFHDEFESSTVVEYGFEVLKRCSESNSESEYTAMSILSLLLLNREELNEVILKWLLFRDDIQIFRAANRDVKILLNHAVKVGLDFPNYSYSDELVSSVSQLNKPITFSKWCWRFHTETVDERGKSHTSTIAKIIKQPIGYKNLLEELDISLNFISIFIAEKVLEPVIVKRYEYLEIANYLNPLISDTIQLHNENKNKYRKEGHDTDLNLEGIITNLTNLQKQLRSLHKLCFYKIPLGPALLSRNSGLLQAIDRMHFKSIFSQITEKYQGPQKMKQFLDKKSLAEARKWCIANEYEDLFLFYDVNLVLVLNAIFENILKHSSNEKFDAFNQDCDGFTVEPKDGDDYFIQCNHRIDAPNGLYHLSFSNKFNKSSPIDSDKSKINRTLRMLNSIGGSGEIKHQEDCFTVHLYLKLVHELEGS